MWKSLTRFLFRTHCLVCQTTVDNLVCDECIDYLPFNTIACPHCAEPMHHSITCGRCLKNPPAFDRAITTFILAPPIQHWIHGFKFQKQLFFAPWFSQQLAKRIRHLNFDAIIAVPLHRKRLASRGYNQAHELAKRLSKILNKPYLSRSIVRTKSTPTQRGLKRKARKQNLKNVFKLTQPIVYQQVLIIDDVLTTGSTANEIAKRLKQSGCKQVSVAAIAKTPVKSKHSSFKVKSSKKQR